MSRAWIGYRLVGLGQFGFAAWDASQNQVDLGLLYNVLSGLGMLLAALWVRRIAQGEEGASGLLMPTLMAVALIRILDFAASFRGNVDFRGVGFMAVVAGALWNATASFVGRRDEDRLNGGLRWGALLGMIGTYCYVLSAFGTNRLASIWIVAALLGASGWTWFFFTVRRD
jgi:hypothetical protein